MSARAGWRDCWCGADDWMLARVLSDGMTAVMRCRVCGREVTVKHDWL